MSSLLAYVCRHCHAYLRSDVRPTACPVCGGGYLMLVGRARDSEGFEARLAQIEEADRCLDE